MFQEPLIGSYHTVADSRHCGPNVLELGTGGGGSSLMKKVQIQGGQTRFLATGDKSAQGAFWVELPHIQHLSVGQGAGALVSDCLWVSFSPCKTDNLTMPTEN